MTPTRWTVQRKALRDLVLQVLDQHGPIEDLKSGRVSSIVRTKCGLADSATIGKVMSAVLKLMEEDGLIRRKTKGTKTFAVTLVAPLSTPERKRLAVEAERNRQLLQPRKTRELAELYRTGHALILAHARSKGAESLDKSTFHMSVSTLLEDAGFYRHERDLTMSFLERAGFMRSNRVAFAGVWTWTLDMEWSFDSKEVQRIFNEQPRIPRCRE